MATLALFPEPPIVVMPAKAGMTVSLDWQQSTPFHPSAVVGTQAEGRRVSNEPKPTIAISVALPPQSGYQTFLGGC